MIKLETLQDILKKRRKQLKLSLRDASKLIGISHSYLFNLEKGVDPRNGSLINPTPETLDLISKAYNLNYNELLNIVGYLEDEPYPNANKFIDLVREEVKRYGYDLNDKSKEEIAKLIIKALKIDEINKSN